MLDLEQLDKDLEMLIAELPTPVTIDGEVFDGALSEESYEHEGSPLGLAQDYDANVILRSEGLPAIHQRKRVLLNGEPATVMRHMVSADRVQTRLYLKYERAQAVL